MKRLYTLIACFSMCQLMLAQPLTWTGNAKDNDFFNEQNWREGSVNTPPAEGTINPVVSINRWIYLNNANNPVVANGIIQLGSGRLFVNNSLLTAPRVQGGWLVIGKQAYVELSDTDPLKNNKQINFTGSLSWLKLEEYSLVDFNANFSSHVLVNNASATSPENFLIDAYYGKGTVLRLVDNTVEPLTIYGNTNYSGTNTKIALDKIYSGLAIPSGLDDKISSFVLERGFMLTIAENADGTGLSKVYIASERNLEIDELPDNLKSDISFIRVVPWQWVTKKGVGGNITGLNETWFYNWGNGSSSSSEIQFTPMSWGKGGHSINNQLISILIKRKQLMC